MPKFVLLNFNQDPRFRFFKLINFEVLQKDVYTLQMQFSRTGILLASFCWLYSHVASATTNRVITCDFTKNSSSEKPNAIACYDFHKVGNASPVAEGSFLATSQNLVFHVRSQITPASDDREESIETTLAVENGTSRVSSTFVSGEDDQRAYFEISNEGVVSCLVSPSEG